MPQFSSMVNCLPLVTLSFLLDCANNSVAATCSSAGDPELHCHLHYGTHRNTETKAKERSCTHLLGIAHSTHSIAYIKLRCTWKECEKRSIHQQNLTTLEPCTFIQQKMCASICEECRLLKWPMLRVYKQLGAIRSDVDLVVAPPTPATPA